MCLAAHKHTFGLVGRREVCSLLCCLACQQVAFSRTSTPGFPLQVLCFPQRSADRSERSTLRQSLLPQLGLGARKEPRMQVEYNYIVGRTVVCMPCFTTNRSLSGIEPSWSASALTLFSVVRPGTEHSIFDVSLVGFISSE